MGVEERLTRALLTLDKEVDDVLATCTEFADTCNIVPAVPSSSAVSAEAGEQKSGGVRGRGEDVGEPVSASLESAWLLDPAGPEDAEQELEKALQAAALEEFITTRVETEEQLQLGGGRAWDLPSCHKVTMPEGRMPFRCISYTSPQVRCIAEAARADTTSGMCAAAVLRMEDAAQAVNAARQGVEAMDDAQATQTLLLLLGFLYPVLVWRAVKRHSVMQKVMHFWRAVHGDAHAKAAAEAAAQEQLPAPPKFGPVQSVRMFARVLLVLIGGVIATGAFIWLQWWALTSSFGSSSSSSSSSGGGDSGIDSDSDDVPGSDAMWWGFALWVNGWFLIMLVLLARADPREVAPSPSEAAAAHAPVHHTLFGSWRNSSGGAAQQGYAPMTGTTGPQPTAPTQEAVYLPPEP